MTEGLRISSIPGRKQRMTSSILKMSGVPWLADDFSHPERLDLATGHHLRPIRENDVDID
jgi:hypothetical protein